MNESRHGGIGIMGGSFDPVHISHIELARAAFKYANLDKIVFLPAYFAPLRDSSPSANASSRLEMLRLALAEFPYPYEISDIEINSGKIRYSVDSARDLKKKYDSNNLFWIIGGDHLGKLEKWHNLPELCKMVTFLCAMRLNCPTPQKLPECAKIEFLRFSPNFISSSLIRILFTEKKFNIARQYLNPDVFDYILENRIYFR